MARCEMIVGYLVPHRCPEQSVGKCVSCGREYCQEHLTIETEGLICRACQEGRTDKPILNPLPAGTHLDQPFTESDLQLFDVPSRFDFDDTFSDLS